MTYNPNSQQRLLLLGSFVAVSLLLITVTLMIMQHFKYKERIELLTGAASQTTNIPHKANDQSVELENPLISDTSQQYTCSQVNTDINYIVGFLGMSFEGTAKGKPQVKCDLSTPMVQLSQ